MDKKQISTVSVDQALLLQRERSQEVSRHRVFKAVAIGLGVGTLAVAGTVGIVATHLSRKEDLHGAALITATLAAIGGGSLAEGGGGMVGGLENLLKIGAAGVAIGAGSSVMYDAVTSSVDAAGLFEKPSPTPIADAVKQYV